MTLVSLPVAIIKALHHIIWLSHEVDTTFTMFLVDFKLAFEDVSFLCDELSFAMFKTLKPLALIGSTLVKDESSVTREFAKLEVALVDIRITQNFASISMWLVFMPITHIKVANFVSHASLALLLIVLKAAFIDVAIIGYFFSYTDSSTADEVSFIE